MEWLTVIVWGLVALLALPVGAGAVVSPMLGVQALAALGGLVLSILFIVLDGGDALAWIGFGLGVLGTLAVGAGAARLAAEDRPDVLGAEAAEVQALLAGFEWPLFAVAAGLTALMALGIATVTV